MTRRMTLLILLLTVLLATVILVYTYPVEREKQIDRDRILRLTQWRKKTFELLTQNRIREAELMALRILRSEPDDRPTRHLQVRILLSSGNAKGAEALCRELLRSAPQDAFARNNLGLLMMDNKRMDEGFQELILANRLSPENRLIRYNLYRAAQLLGKSGFPPPDAMPDFNEEPGLLSLAPPPPSEADGKNTVESDRKGKP